MAFNRKYSLKSLTGLLLTIALLVLGVPALFAPSNNAQAQACPGAGDPPTPTEVAVSAVPIVVESTTADYFVLYASHDVDGETVWYPVKVALGEDGTTTLAENVAPLAVERYRVEKYLIVNPADVDGDCTDDITEFNNLGTMSPVNSAITVDPGHGALAIPDRETFEDLAHPVPGDAWHLKIVIADMDTDRPGVYFLDASELPRHSDLLDEIDVSLPDMISGLIVYDPDLVAPNGSSGVFRYRIYVPYFSFNHLDHLYHPFSFYDRIHTLLAANIPLLEDNLALWISNQALTDTQADLPLYRASRMNLLLDEDVNSDTTFQSLNPGEGYGLLRNLDPDERPHSRDVVIYETLPNELPRVAGIISTVPQTPLSHVNLRALQDSIPNAFIANALEDNDISGLIDSHVHYAVTDTGYSIRAATQAEVDEHFASSRPEEAQTPQRDLSVTTITPLSDIGFDHWDSFGVKAANVAVLRTLGFPEGTVPNGFAVPFHFYDEFMKHNDLYDYIEDMLGDSDFQTDYDTKGDELKKLRKKIKNAETPEWIETALTEMHATFPEGTSLRYRSSTNNEDLPNFNGAGLYDSKTQHPEETEEDGISKSLKQVYASLWNFRAFVERDFHRIDHLAAAMGVLVHPNYSDEPVNGVAVSVDPAYGTEGSHYVNTQVGEDLVTNPEAHSVPEEVLLYPDDTRRVIALSNQVPQGQLLMTGEQLGQVRRHLVTIHEKFAELYGVEDSERFAMEIEFKITSDNVLAIKQARPWVFAAPPPAVDNAHTGNTGIALMASFDAAPTTHDGSPFTFRILFSEIPAVRSASFRDNAVKMSGGSVTRARRVDGREDLWEFMVSPDSLGDVTIVLPNNIPCTIPGAICSINGRRLSTRLEHTVESLLPRVPDRFTWRGLSPDSVSLGWNDAARGDSYQVQLLHHGQWATLPADRIEIAFDGTSAVVSGLPSDDVYSFRVRAVNSKGVSAWSDPLFIPIRVDLDSELTAGRNDQVFPVQSGYDSLASLDGTLSPDSFEINGTTYRVRNIVRSSESLWLGMYQELPADFTLFVGDSVYLGSESLVPPTSEGEGYWWPSAPPDWSVDSPVRVGLILHPAIPLGERQKAPVAGYFRNFPSEHDGHEDFSFRIYFSEGIPTTADALRDHVLSVSGGTVSGMEAVVSDGRIWAVSVTPESHHPVTVGIEADLDCQSSAAICAADGRRLFNRMELTVQAVENSPATGAPTITGTVEVGEILIMDTSDIADANGLTRETFTYQWVAYDGHSYTDVQGATDSAYTLVPADEGKAFRVRVSFNDYVGYEESLISALARSEQPYGLNASESDGEVTLTWRLPAGWTGSTFQILRNRPELGETEPLVHVRFAQTNGATYTDTDVEPGVLYVYRVKGVDPFGYTGEASQPFEIRTEDTGAAPARPNVVIILADDLGWGDVQTNNPDSAMTTPRIDSIAAAGAHFTDAHTPSSMCSPTRYGLLTGRYAWRTWLTSGVLGGHDRPLIGPDRATLGTLLQGHGYRTAAIGKWHLGMDFNRLSDVDAVTDINKGIDFDAEIVDGPTDHGFDEFFGTSANLRWEPHIYIRDSRFLANPGREDRPASGFYKPAGVLDRLTEEAVAFIEREGQTESPFFLYLPVHSPHVPLVPNDHFDGLTGLGAYADVVAQIDWTVGQVLDAIDRTGASDDTLVIFTSDNGSFMEGIPVSNHVTHWSSGRWRGAKGQIHEGGHRVPLLMQWPRSIESGSTIDATVSLTDLYATLADIVGEEAAPGVAPDSVSLLPLLRGDDVTRGVPVVHHSRSGMFALRDDYWKLVFGNGDGSVHGTNTGEPFGRPWRLIDLERDHKEKTNVAIENPQVVARMEAALERLRAAEDGTLSSDATLRVLNLAGIDIGPFDPGVRSYTATVAKRIEDIAVSAIPTATDAHVIISDASGSADKGPRRMSLAYPATTIKVTVTSPDTSATATYTVTVTRSQVTVVGMAEVGETLSVDTSGVADADGLTGATFSYQWIRNDGGTDSDIVGATGATYALAAEDQGTSVLVRVGFTDDGGNAETLTSPPTTEVEAALTAEFQRVPDTHESTTFVFHVLFSEPVDTSSQALREHSLEMSNGTIVEARRVDGRNDLWEIEVLPLTHADVVVTLPPTEDCADAGAVCTVNGKRLSSRLQTTVGPSANSPPQGAPTIGGTPEVGQTLTADTSGIADADGLTGATFSYQWVSYDGDAYTDIPGATSSTYTLVQTDESKAFRVRVSFTDDAGNSHSLTSPLARSERPYGLNASESDGAVVLTWRLPVGWTGSTFRILRNRPELGESEPLVHVRYFQTEANAYTDTDVEPGVLYVYRVKGVDPFGYTGEASRPLEVRTAEATPASARPNVVIILADDLGWGDVQTNNPDSVMTTPHIDSIAAAGAYFTDAHTPSATCSPTRYGLLTGRYSWRSWLKSSVLGGHDRPMIGPDRPTLGTLLQDHGYRTAAIGKWHVGMDFTRLSNIDEFTSINAGINFESEVVDGPLNHGFDEFFGTSANLGWPPSVYIRDRRFLANPDREGQPASGFVVFDEVLDRHAEEAVAFIEREGQTEAPFFLYLPLNAPHRPLAPNAHFDGLTGLGAYADVVAQVDWTVGQVLDALDRAGARDNTLVVFTSDNGSSMGGIPVPNHADHQPNGGWRGGKGTIHEGGHRVPLLMQWPRGIEAGSALDATVSLIDMYATLADIVGDGPEQGVAIDSVSLLPLLRGEAVTRGVPVVNHSTAGMFALRDGRWKLVFGNGSGLPWGGQSKPFVRPWELFDLKQDHRETRNLAESHPEVVARMSDALERFRAAEDGTLSSDATLRVLNLAGIDIGPFDPGVRSYTATVAKRIEDIAVSAIPTAMDAHVKISDASGSANKGHRRLRLAYPATTIVVNVISPDTSATATYTVTVKRSHVTVLGTAEVGETLSVDTSGVGDGLTGSTFSYQWVRNDGGTDSDIEGATGATYALAAEDEGTSVLVRVGFTDDGGNAETLTSPPTTEVEAALTAEFQRVPDTHESTTFVFHVLFSEPVDTSYQALREHSLEMSNGTIVEARRVDGRNDLWEIEVQPLTHADVVVTLPPTVDCADAGAVCTKNGKRFSSRLQTTVGPSANSPPRGAPTISGTVEPGYTLTADTSGIADADGLTGTTFSYQWVSYDGNADADIQGATDSTYTLLPADEGNAFRVRVSFTDDAGNRQSLTSGLARSERPYGLNASESDGAVVLTWNLPAGWSGSTFRILRNRPELGEVEPLVHVRFTESGMTAYTDTDVEPGVLNVYRVKGVDPFGYTGEASQPFEIRTAGPTPVENSPATGAPTISGTAQAGETLAVDTSVIADADGLTGAAFSYKWLADDAEIPDATGSTYTLTAADVGKTIRVRVSFTDDAGNTESLTSAATAEVEAELPINSPATGSPSITGTAQVGQTLTASVSGIADEDGLTNATFAYQWIRTDGSTDTEIAGATSTTYTPVNSDKSKAVMVRVSFTDDAGHKETLTGMATAAIAPPPLTASFHTDDTPENHDGQTAFTFELRFSEEFELSYTTLRDHAFTIADGTIANANRLDPPSNLRWRLTVEPDSNGDVTIVLPITTNCNDDGAICTPDDRMLSNRLELTVEGQ